MAQRIVLKVKELGELTGEFLKTTKGSIWLNDVYVGKATTSHISLIKISKASIISVTRASQPPLHLFTDSQLEYITTMKSSAYAEAAAKMLRERNGSSARHQTAIPDAKCIDESPENKTAPQKAAIPHKKTPSSAMSEPVSKKLHSKNGKSNGEWNQLETNARLFGIKPSFNFDEYATPIDKKDKDYHKKMEISAKIAKEILKEKTDDMHKLEERGISRQPGKSDDVLYSSVGSNLWEAKEEPSKAVRENKPVSNKQSTANPTLATHKAREELINTAVKEYHDRVQDAMNGEDKGNMWASVTSMLSARKRVEDQLRELDLGKNPKAEPTAPKPPKSKQDPQKKAVQPELRSPQNDKSTEKGPKKDKGASKHFASDPKPPKADKPVLTPKPSQEKQNLAEEPESQPSTPTSEKRSPKQIIIGRKLRFEKMSSIMETICSCIGTSLSMKAPASWGFGPTVEERSNRYLEKVTFRAPSDERISEISTANPKSYYRK